MVKRSLLEYMKFFFKVSTMCRSNLFRYFWKEKSFFQLPAGDATVKLFEMFIIYCSVRVKTEKLYLLIYREKFANSNGRMLSLQRKSFSSKFSRCVDHSFQGMVKLSLFTHHSEMIVRCLSSSVAHYETNNK